MDGLQLIVSCLWSHFEIFYSRLNYLIKQPSKREPRPQIHKTKAKNASEMKSVERWKFACGGALQAFIVYRHGIGMHQAEVALIKRA